MSHSSTRVNLPISVSDGPNEIDPLVTSALSECSSGLARRGPPADAERKRIRVAPSTARPCISKLRSPQRNSLAPKCRDKQSARIAISKPENLVTRAQSENLVGPPESENLTAPINIATASPATSRASSNLAISPSVCAGPLRKGQIREHNIQGDVHMQAAARDQVVKSAAEHASAPQRKRRNIGDTSSSAADVKASRAQHRGKVRTRGVEGGTADPAMATAHAVDSAFEHASEPPRKRQHAQPRHLTVESV